MALSQRLKHVLVGVVIGVIVAGGGIGVAAVARSSGTAHKGLIRGCINKRTRAVTIRAKCGTGTKAIAWNGTGQRGATGATGATGAAGPEGQASAWGELTPDPSTKTLLVQPGSSNVLAAEYDAPGEYTIVVGGCSGSGDHADEVQVGSGQDVEAQGSNDLGNITDPVTALTPKWGYVVTNTIDGKQWPPQSMYFDVDVYDLKTQTDTDADVSFSVNC